MKEFKAEPVLIDGKFSHIKVMETTSNTVWFDELEVKKTIANLRANMAGLENLKTDLMIMINASAGFLGHRKDRNAVNRLYKATKSISDKLQAHAKAVVAERVEQTRQTA